MENIRCKNCNSIAVKRKGSEFCSVKCKNQYWNSLKTQKTENGTNKADNSSLKNDSLGTETEIIPPKRIKKTEKVETFSYTIIKTKLQKLLSKRNSIALSIEDKVKELQASGENNPLGAVFIGALLGGAKGIGGAGIGALGGLLLNNLLGKETPKFQQNLTAEISQLQDTLHKTEKQITELEQELSSTIQYQTLERMVDNPAYLVYQFRKRIALEKENLQKAKESKQVEVQKREQIEKEKQAQAERKKMIEELECSENFSQANFGSAEYIDQQESELNTDSIPEIEKKQRIISSKELAAMKFTTLNFQGKWQHFLGQPSEKHYAVIHGRAGSGKSTFTIKYAFYLSLKFGNVLYISSEEGFSKTFQLKFENQKAQNDNLHLSDLRSKEEIIENVPKDKYNFIVLDSVNNMKIDAEGIKELNEYFSNSTIIAIAQSTKDGKMRGSNEIIHDCDIEISVDHGIATTIKNRFQEIGREYKVF